MLNIKEDIQPLTTFRNNSVKLMRHLKKTGRPLVLTINGRAEAVVQDAAAYQRLIDLAAHADAGEGISQGLEDVRKSRTRPLAEFLDAFRLEHDIPR